MLVIDVACVHMHVVFLSGDIEGESSPGSHLGSLPTGKWGKAARWRVLTACGDTYAAERGSGRITGLCLLP